ncbi:MAG: hypothetical protein WAV10_00695 [Minisyncoccia bacterium]
MIKNINNKKIKGYALLEIIFYIAIFSILTLAVINAIIVMTKAFKETSIQTDFVQSSTIMERISREIRQANGINSINNNGNNLILNTKDDVGNDKTIEFLLTDSNLQIKENDVLIGNLNTPNIIITGLSFDQITTVKGLAVRVVFNAKSFRDGSNRIEDFYDTIVLRGKYSN